jgi:hypothetical protein
MDDNFLDDLPLPHSPPAQHAVLVAALLHLMSHYTTREREQPCVKLASVIERHLQALARSADADPVLRATCEQLSAKWAGVVDSALPAPARRPLLERILRPVARKAQPLPAAA